MPGEVERLTSTGIDHSWDRSRPKPIHDRGQRTPTLWDLTDEERDELAGKIVDRTLQHAQAVRLAEETKRAAEDLAKSAIVRLLEAAKPLLKWLAAAGLIGGGGFGGTVYVQHAAEEATRAAAPAISPAITDQVTANTEEIRGVKRSVGEVAASVDKLAEGQETLLRLELERLSEREKEALKPDLLEQVKSAAGDG